jgi:hypothetical protein
MWNRRIASVVLLLAGFALDAAAGQRPPESRWVELGTPQLAKRGSVMVLRYNIKSTSSKDQWWALVDVNGSEETRPCDWLKTLAPNQSYSFECPLKNPAGQKYDLRVRIFRDAKLEDRELMYEPTLSVTPQMITAAENIGSAPAAVPLGTFENIAAPLPAVFKPTWYRRVNKGFGMKAYENSGDLTVSADELLFVDGKMTLRIPKDKIISIRWEPLDNDIANHWIVVRFTNGEGKEDGVGFRDGARMGTRGKSGPAYQAVRGLKK